jgi:hypothetical protein
VPRAESCPQATQAAAVAATLGISARLSARPVLRSDGTASLTWVACPTGCSSRSGAVMRAQSSGRAPCCCGAMGVALALWKVLTMLSASGSLGVLPRHVPECTWTDSLLCPQRMTKRGTLYRVLWLRLCGAVVLSVAATAGVKGDCGERGSRDQRRGRRNSAGCHDAGVRACLP